MKTFKNTPWALGALVLLVGLAAPLWAGEAELRKRALDLNTVTGGHAVKGQVLVLLEKSQQAETKKLLAVAVKMAKEKPQPFGPNATLILADTASNPDLKEYEAAEVFYRLHADQMLQMLSASGLSVAYDGLIRVLYNAKKYAECEKLCREFLEIDGGDDSIDRAKPRILERMIMAMARQGETDKAVDILDRLVKKQPENWLVLEWKARVLREAGKLEEALKTYEDVSDRIKADKRLEKKDQDDFLDDVRYSLSGLYVDLNQIDKAAEQLKALLTREPDNPTYNNDLGYIWADHDQNLEESEKLIRKALEEDRKLRHKAKPDITPEEDKDSAPYLDSLGWVLFKQKKYKEAKPYLQQAVQDEAGKHVEIYDHLGDVHMALGDKAEAIAAWKKGIEVAGTGKREQQRKAAVEKKLKANQ
jgi:tetratricopeptide (TPR) repeat protein